jgi:hypothetical protein
MQLYCRCRCIGVRYKRYKWLGDAHKVEGNGPTYMAGNTSITTALYKFENGLHLELPCMEVRQARQAVLAQQQRCTLLRVWTVSNSGACCCVCGQSATRCILLRVWAVSDTVHTAACANSSKLLKLVHSTVVNTGCSARI